MGNNLKRYFGRTRSGELFADETGVFVLYSDHAAREKELLEALREYRHPDYRDGVFHDECFKDDSRNVDTRCAVCKKADALLKGES